MYTTLDAVICCSAGTVPHTRDADCNVISTLLLNFCTDRRARIQVPNVIQYIAICVWQCIHAVLISCQWCVIVHWLEVILWPSGTRVIWTGETVWKSNFSGKMKSELCLVNVRNHIANWVYKSNFWVMFKLVSGGDSILRALVSCLYSVPGWRTFENLVICVMVFGNLWRNLAGLRFDWSIFVELGPD